jgi:hypothetical protein
MMLALVTNFGATRHIPTVIGNVFFAHGTTVEMDNEKAIREIEAYPHLKVEWKKPRKKAALKLTAVELAQFPINTLRKMAHRAGIKGYFTMKKTVLIKRLEA